MSRQHRTFESTASPAQQTLGNGDGARVAFQVGDQLPRRMSVRDMCRAFPINGHPMDRSTFYAHERAGKFERFELKPQIGAKAWSGTLVARYLDCEAGASRFVTVAGRKLG